MSNEQAEEVWLPIAGFEGFYRISNLGRVESMCRGRPRILKPFRDNYGYELIGLLSGTVKRPSSKVHSLVATQLAAISGDASFSWLPSCSSR